MLASKAQENDKSTPFCPYTGASLRLFSVDSSDDAYMGKTGTIWQFYAVSRCFVYQDSAHASTQNPPHFRAFPASIWEHSPPKCLFFKASAKLPNRPGFVLLRKHLPATEVIWPFGPKVGKRARPQGQKKSKTESKKSQNSSKTVDFDSFSTPFWTFWAPGPRGPGNSFSDSFSNFGPEGPK